MAHFIPSVIELVLVTDSSRHHVPLLTGVQDFILGPSLFPRVNLVLVTLLSLLTLYRHAVVPLTLSRLVLSFFLVFILVLVSSG